MKKLIAALAACFALFMFVAVKNGFSEPLRMHSFELGAQISHITYEEPALMQEKGFMYGIEGSYTYHNIYMIKAEGRFSFGTVDYSSPFSGTLDNIPDYMIELRGMGGYDFVASGIVVTPFAGLGYRYLNDDVGGMVTSTGAVGYERESNYIYSPIGVEALIELKHGWSVGGTIEYDYFWYGKQISHFSDVAFGFNNVENGQNEGYGLRGSVKFIKSGGRVDYIIKPFIRFWSIEESEVSVITFFGVPYTYGVEPENDSTEIGLEFAVRF